MISFRKNHLACLEWKAASYFIVHTLVRSPEVWRLVFHIARRSLGSSFTLTPSKDVNIDLQSAAMWWPVRLSGHNESGKTVCLDPAVVSMWKESAPSHAAPSLPNCNEHHSIQWCWWSGCGLQSSCSSKRRLSGHLLSLWYHTGCCGRAVVCVLVLYG